jgi:hypothetical protein
MDAVDKLAKLWDIGDDEDRQGMARSLFSYIVYDLDIRRIVDFRLKPWADRFLVLRSALYEDDETSENGSPSGIKPQAEDVAPEGYKATRLLTAEEAMQCLLELLYAGKKLERKTWEKRERNVEIYHRYLAGEDSMVLSRVYGLSDRRIRSIIEHERKRQ